MSPPLDKRRLAQVEQRIGIERMEEAINLLVSFHEYNRLLES